MAGCAGLRWPLFVCSALGAIEGIVTCSTSLRSLASEGLENIMWKPAVEFLVTVVPILVNLFLALAAAVEQWPLVSAFSPLYLSVSMLQVISRLRGQQLEDSDAGHGAHQLQPVCIFICLRLVGMSLVLACWRESYCQFVEAASSSPEELTCEEPPSSLIF